jgi:hypothetical protein
MDFNEYKHIFLTNFNQQLTNRAAMLMSAEF